MAVDITVATDIFIRRCALAAIKVIFNLIDLLLEQITECFSSGVNTLNHIAFLIYYYAVYVFIFYYTDLCANRRFPRHRFYTADCEQFGHQHRLLAVLIPARLFEPGIYGPVI